MKAQLYEMAKIDATVMIFAIVAPRAAGMHPWNDPGAARGVDQSNAFNLYVGRSPPSNRVIPSKYRDLASVRPWKPGDT